MRQLFLQVLNLSVEVKNLLEEGQRNTSKELT